jgi:hypothetical protein
MSIKIEIDDTKTQLFLAIAQNYHSTNTLECDLLDDIARIIRGEELYGYEGVRRIEQPEWTEKML